MNNYFVARFEQVSNSASFTADKNGRLPYIGTILAGVAKGSLINGTMFQRDNLKEGQMYLAENFVEEEYPDQQQVRIIAPISAVEFLALSKDLGKGILVRNTSEDNDEDVAVDTTAEIVAETVDANAVV